MSFLQHESAFFFLCSCEHLIKILNFHPSLSLQFHWETAEIFKRECVTRAQHQPKSSCSSRVVKTHEKKEHTQCVTLFAFCLRSLSCHFLKFLRRKRRCKHLNLANFLPKIAFCFSRLWLLLSQLSWQLCPMFFRLYVRPKRCSLQTLKSFIVFVFSFSFSLSSPCFCKEGSFSHPFSHPFEFISVSSWLIIQRRPRLTLLFFLYNFFVLNISSTRIELWLRKETRNESHDFGKLLLTL